MVLLTKELRKRMPVLYSTEETPMSDKQVVCKFFTPDANWTWYVVEGAPVLDDGGNEVDFEFWGLVDGHEKEVGYFTLNQLREVRGRLGLPIERDRYFGKKTLLDIAPSICA